MTASTPDPSLTDLAQRYAAEAAARRTLHRKLRRQRAKARQVPSPKHEES